MKILIKHISADKTFTMRHEILRPQGELEECFYPNDNDEGAFHLGAFLADELVGIASFFPENNSSINSKDMYRLRGMASSPELRGKGIGSKLISVATEELKLRGVSDLWCNAREIALPFYLKLRFKFCSDMFDIEGIGPHKVMALNITRP